MQYKLFSFFKTWLPQIPSSELDHHFKKQQHLSNDGDTDKEDGPLSEDVPLLDVAVEPLSYCGGKDEFLKALNISTNITVTEMSKQPILLEKLQNVESVSRTHV